MPGISVAPAASITVPAPDATAAAERLVQAQGLRTVILNRCGHWTPIERAEDSARELRAFLAAQR
jgi:pimeloyl-ACP methyl ester carboxylesterase